MKMNLNAEGMCLGCAKHEGKDKPYYTLSLMIGDEAGTIAANADVYQSYENGEWEKLNNCRIHFIYNSDYKYLQAVSVTCLE